MYIRWSRDLTDIKENVLFGRQIQKCNYVAILESYYVVFHIKFNTEYSYKTIFQITHSLSDNRPKKQCHLRIKVNWSDNKTKFGKVTWWSEKQIEFYLWVKITL